MADKPETLFIYDTRENVAMSWLRDGFSFGCLCFAAWFVNTQMPPSGWINMMVAFVWIIWMIGKGAKRKMLKSPTEARAWLDENFPESVAQ